VLLKSSRVLDLSSLSLSQIIIIDDYGSKWIFHVQKGDSEGAQPYIRKSHMAVCWLFQVGALQEVVGEETR